MRTFLAIMSCIYILTGCKNSTKEFEQLAEQACTCADADEACGAKAMADLTSFAEHNKASDGDQKRILEAGKRINDCLLSTGMKPKAVTAALEKMIR
jgi:hypothetical protein